jgi:hypothetical protein
VLCLQVVWFDTLSIFLQSSLRNENCSGGGQVAGCASVSRRDNQISGNAKYLDINALGAHLFGERQIGMGRSQRLSVFSSELGHSMASTVTGLKMLKNIESTKKPHNICLGGHTRGLGTNSHSFSLFLPAPITSDYTQSGK